MGPRTQKTKNDAPLLSAMVGIGILLLLPIALYLLGIKWGDDIQRQVAACMAIGAMSAFLLIKAKYDALIVCLVFFSQINLSLISFALDEPVKLQILFSDIIFAMFLLASIERRARIKFDAIGWLMLALILWQVVAAVKFTAHASKSAVFLIWQVKYLVIYLLIVNYQMIADVAPKLIYAALFVIAIQAILGIAQYASGGMLGLAIIGEQASSNLFFVDGALRISGTLGATNAFAGYMAVLLIFVLPFLIEKSRAPIYMIYCIGLLSLMLALSRAAWLSFFIGGLAGVFGVIRTRCIPLTRVAVLSLSGAALVLSASAVYLDKIVSRFEDKESVSSAMGRLQQFADAWPIIEKHSAFGIGAGVTEYFGIWNDSRKYVRENIRDIRLTNQPHNSFLQYAIESGAPALILFLFIGAVTFYGAFSWRGIQYQAKNIRAIRIGAGSAALAALVHTSFGTEINNHQIMLIFWVLLAVSRNRSNPPLGR